MACKSNSGDAIFSSDAYSIYSDRVVQDSFEAKAVSATEMISNYEIPANEFQDANISFKFSINGKDNEMLPGTDHQVTIKAKDGLAQSSLIVFGKQNTEPKEENVYLQPATQWTLQLDMREVQKQFADVGFYTSVKGDKIYKEDFKAVYVAGNTLPMTWDFDNLKNRPELELKDPDGDGIFETTLLLNNKADVKKIDTIWKLSRDISAFPKYSSPHVLADAIYNMSLEEMEKAVEKDSTLRTGAEWAGVWTRDVSYSIILSMAYMQPQVAKNSLRRKVNKRKRIIQDTGTGGAWPVSTDRMIWAVAAWEIYLATGDMDWLREAYEVIKLSLEDDYKVAYDPVTGLVNGESSFLDWREQTYPKWMQPADIFESKCLGTNAVHFQANTVAAKMAILLEDKKAASVFETKAVSIKTGINSHLWQEDKGYYGQYLYGRLYQSLSPRSEALGEALSVVFDIADAERQKRVVESTPIVSFGIPCIFPQIPGIPPYHNNGIWPFVQTYWLWAGAKVGNEQSVMESIGAIYRPSALFLTNKENFVADNGDFSGTVINSSNMLWSLSGNISLVHKVLFGIRFTEDGITFKPFVPTALKGNRSLSNFKYRNAVLDIEMVGFGDAIQTITLDGQLLEAANIETTLAGKHNIKIILNNKIADAGKVNKVANHFTLATLNSTVEAKVGNASRIKWSGIEGEIAYEIFKDGKILQQQKETSYYVKPDDGGMYQVRAMDAEGNGSFLSEPFGYYASESIIRVEAETFAPKASYSYKGFSGSGFVEIAVNKNSALTVEVNVDKAGTYALSFLYANGNGPINTENKCAIRSLYMNDGFKGAVIFPQRGTNEWSAWGETNSYVIKFAAGKQRISLRMEDWNENMNGEINQAMIDQLLLRFLHP
jgi:hypothetical protein